MPVHDGFKTATICLAVFSILLIAALVVVAIEFSTAKKLLCANVMKPTSGSVKLEYSCPVQQPDGSTFATLASYEDVQNAYNVSELPDDYYWISKPAKGAPLYCTSYKLLKKNGTFICGDDNDTGYALSLIHI